MNNKHILFLSFLFFTAVLFSQVQIQGVVIDKQTKQPINNTNIFVQKTNIGTISNKKGHFILKISKTNFILEISSIGYTSKQIKINSVNEKYLNLGVIYLNPKNENLNEIVISNVNSFAKERKTPIASSTFKSNFISENIGIKDLPEILNNSPSIYATKNGGAYGDTSINVRGFDQRNIAVLINNIPVNDMETGWVYWSNWMNLPEVTSTIQVQRGLGVSKLAIPSVGGTINILTDASKLDKGGSLFYQYSSENAHKKTIGYNTGLLKNGLSASFLLGHFNGQGYVDETQAEAYSYFINLGFKQKKHHIMLTIIGAPQWHNQHNTASTLNDYLKYSNNNQPNIKYNSEWGFLQNNSFTWSKNFFHKPISSLNWDWKINSSTKLSTVVYTVFGKGGGTAPIGAINYNYPNNDVFKDINGQVKFDAIYQWNSGNQVNEFGANNSPNLQGKYLNQLDKGLSRYAFINNQAWYGTLINFKKKINNTLRLDVGFDGRLTSGKNALTVNHTLGADGYIDNFDINHPNNIIYPSNFVEAKPYWNVFKSIDDLEKIVFFNQSKIRWFSLFSQLEYSKNRFSAFMQTGISNQQFQRIDFFNYPQDKDNDGQIEPQQSKWKYLNGGNIKIGLNYNINEHHNVFSNSGFYSKQPLFDAVFSNYDNHITESLNNEKIKSIEIGYGFKNEKIALKLNTYYTSWKDRFSKITSFVDNENLYGRLNGLEEIHKGLELEGQLNHRKITLNAMVSFGDWKYRGNITNVNLYNYTQQLITTKDFYLDDVKVGNAPQFTALYSLKYKALKNLEFTVNQFFVDRLYAKIDIANFTNPIHQGALKLPKYNVMNTGINYSFNIPNFSKVKLNFLINNLFNTVYISKSETNFFPESNQTNWNGINTKNRVFFGWGRTYTFGVNLKF